MDELKRLLAEFNELREIALSDRKDTIRVMLYVDAADKLGVYVSNNISKIGWVGDGSTGST